MKPFKPIGFIRCVGTLRKLYKNAHANQTHPTRLQNPFHKFGMHLPKSLYISVNIYPIPTNEPHKKALVELYNHASSPYLSPFKLINQHCEVHPKNSTLRVQILEYLHGPLRHLHPRSMTQFSESKGRIDDTARHPRV